MRDKIILIFLFSSELITYINPFLGAKNIKLVFYSILLLLYLSKYILVKYDGFRVQKDFFFFSFIPFILAYFIRIIYDLYVSNIGHIIYENKFTYIFLVINSIFLPFIFMRTVNYNKLNYTNFYKILTVLLTLSVLISFYRMFTEGIAAVQIDSGRISANENLDPIAFGHLGVTLFLIGLHNFINRKKLIINFINILIMLIGLISMALANSRSPLLALFIVLVIYMVAKKKIKILVVSSIIMAVIILFIEKIDIFLQSYGSTFVNRIINSINYSNIEKLSSGRSILYNTGLENLLENPLLGGPFLSQDISIRGQYYHNFVIEAFVSLGFFGGLLYLVLIGISMVKAFKLLKINTQYCFVSFLFFQQLIYSLFSRSFTNLPLFWFSLFLVNYIYESNKVSKKIF